MFLLKRMFQHCTKERGGVSYNNATRSFYFTLRLLSVEREFLLCCCSCERPSESVPMFALRLQPDANADCCQGCKKLQNFTGKSNLLVPTFVSSESSAGFTFYSCVFFFSEVEFCREWREAAFSGGGRCCSHPGSLWRWEHIMGFSSIIFICFCLLYI